MVCWCGVLVWCAGVVVVFSAACPLLSEYIYQVPKVFYRVLPLHVLQNSIGGGLHWHMKK